MTDIPFEVFTIDGAFSEKDLEMLNSFSSQTSYSEERPFTNSGFKNAKILKPDLASLIHSRICPALPSEYVDRSGKTWTFRGAGQHVFLAEMVPGDLFGLHTDTGSVYDEENKRFSKMTVLVYLTDDFEGGRTNFFTDSFVPTCSVVPKRGRVLVFDIDRFHEAGRVISGVKRWIGVELLSSN